MIIIRKDQLKIIDPTSEPMRSKMPVFDFAEHSAEDIDMMVKVLTRKMIDLGGIGLSANQLGLNYRVFVMGIDGHSTAVFNPEILEHIGEPETFKEGCLSYPGIFMQIKRPPNIRARWQNAKGEVREDLFTGLTARVFQHEFDHMEGTDFTVGVSPLKLKLAKEKYQKKKKKLIREHAIATMKKAIEDGQENSARI